MSFKKNNKKEIVNQYEPKTFFTIDIRFYCRPKHLINASLNIFKREQKKMFGQFKCFGQNKMGED